MSPSRPKRLQLGSGHKTGRCCVSMAGLELPRYLDNDLLDALYPVDDEGEYDSGARDRIQRRSAPATGWPADRRTAPVPTTSAANAAVGAVSGVAVVDRRLLQCLQNQVAKSLLSCSRAGGGPRPRSGPDRGGWCEPTWTAPGPARAHSPPSAAPVGPSNNGPANRAVADVDACLEVIAAEAAVRRAATAASKAAAVTGVADRSPPPPLPPTAGGMGVGFGASSVWTPSLGGRSGDKLTAPPAATVHVPSQRPMIQRRRHSSVWTSTERVETTAAPSTVRPPPSLRSSERHGALTASVAAPPPSGDAARVAHNFAVASSAHTADAAAARSRLTATTHRQQYETRGEEMSSHSHPPWGTAVHDRRDGGHGGNAQLLQRPAPVGPAGSDSAGLGWGQAPVLHGRDRIMGPRVSVVPPARSVTGDGAPGFSVLNRLSGVTTPGSGSTPLPPHSHVTAGPSGRSVTGYTASATSYPARPGSPTRNRAWSSQGHGGGFGGGGGGVGGGGGGVGVSSSRSEPDRGVVGGSATSALYWSARPGQPAPAQPMTTTTHSDPLPRVKMSKVTGRYSDSGSGQGSGMSSEAARPSSEGRSPSPAKPSRSVDVNVTTASSNTAIGLVESKDDGNSVSDGTDSVSTGAVAGAASCHWTRARPRASDWFVFVYGSQLCLQQEPLRSFRPASSRHMDNYRSRHSSNRSLHRCWTRC